MKEVEVPKPVMIAVGVLLLVGIAFGIFMSVGQSAPTVEPSSVSPTRLEDPDPRSSAGGNSGTNNGAN